MAADLVGRYLLKGAVRLDEKRNVSSNRNTVLGIVPDSIHRRILERSEFLASPFEIDA